MWTLIKKQIELVLEKLIKILPNLIQISTTKNLKLNPSQLYSKELSMYVRQDQETVFEVSESCFERWIETEITLLIQ